MFLLWQSGNRAKGLIHASKYYRWVTGSTSILICISSLITTLANKTNPLFPLYTCLLKIFLFSQIRIPFFELLSWFYFLLALCNQSNSMFLNLSFLNLSLKHRKLCSQKCIAFLCIKHYFKCRIHWWQKVTIILTFLRLLLNSV